MRQAPPIDAERMASRWRADMDELEIRSYADGLGVNPHALAALGACYAPLYSAWAFPMRGSNGRAIGIRLRANDGRKWAVAGSRSGIFFDDTDQTWIKETVLICEGPTDTCAAITLGFPAIGKPCCNSGNDYVIGVLRKMRPARVVIVSDVDSMQKDGIGFKEALKLQTKMPFRSAVWAPQAKDLREFLKFGGTRQLIESEIGKMLWRNG